MRTSRLAATATLFVLTGGVLTGGVLAGGTTGAAAADGSPSPSVSVTPSASTTAEPTATATVTTPAPTTGEPTPTASGTATPSATDTPPATATATTSATPSATSTLPAGCESEYQVTMPTHAVPTAATLVRSGPPQNLAFSFYNSSDTVLTDFRITYRVEGPQGSASLKPLVRIQGGPFTPVEPNDGTGTTAVGSFRVPAHEMVTAELRFADDPGTLSGDYTVTVAGSSEVLPYGVGPVNVKYRCNRLLGSLTSRLTLTDPAPVTTAPSTSASPTATGTATPGPSASPTASPSPSATTSGAPGTSGTDSGGPTGPRLAGTGASSSNVPLAVTGGMAIAIGLGAVVVARRRNRTATAATPTTRD